MGNKVFEGELPITASSAGAVIIQPATREGDSGTYVLPLGALGRFMINEYEMDSRFGSEMALRLMDQTKVQQITTKDISGHRRIVQQQIASGSAIHSYAVDELSCFLSDVVAAPREGANFLTSHVKGGMALSVNAAVSLGTLDNTLNNLIRKTEAKSIPTGFNWTEDFSLITDLPVRDDLFAMLGKSVDEIDDTESSSVHFSLPCAIDYESYGRFKFRDRDYDSFLDIPLRDTLKEPGLGALGETIYLLPQNGADFSSEINAENENRNLAHEPLCFLVRECLDFEIDITKLEGVEAFSHLKQYILAEEPSGLSRGPIPVKRTRHQKADDETVSDGAETIERVYGIKFLLINGDWYAIKNRYIERLREQLKQIGSYNGTFEPIKRSPTQKKKSESTDAAKSKDGTSAWTSGLASEGDYLKGNRAKSSSENAGVVNNHLIEGKLCLVLDHKEITGEIFNDSNEKSKAKGNPTAKKKTRGGAESEANEELPTEENSSNEASKETRMEICDIITADAMIHVKKNTGSSVLSHLFKQGLNSAERLMLDEDYRTKANDKIRELLDIKEDEFSDFLIDDEPQKKTIVFAIIENPSKGRIEKPALSLATFSQISLYDTWQRLNMLGYSMKICTIEVEDAAANEPINDDGQ